MFDDDDRKPISGLESLIIDENGMDVLIENVRTDADGKLILNISDIPGDSFLVSIESDNYFNKKVWVDPFAGNKTKNIFLNQRMTTITGVVLDDSTFTGVPNCNVSTSPAIMKTTKTDSSGFFELRSKQFANIPYVILFDKAPEYESNSTNIKPILNEIISFEVPIYLIRKKNDTSPIELEGEETVRTPQDIGSPTN
jgi:hypothetical protein